MREKSSPILLFTWFSSPSCMNSFFQPGPPCSKSCKKCQLHLVLPQVDQWLTIHSCHIFFLYYDSCSKLLRPAVFNTKRVLYLHSCHFLYAIHLFQDRDFSTFHCMDLFFNMGWLGSRSLLCGNSSNCLLKGKLFTLVAHSLSLLSFSTTHQLVLTCPQLKRFLKTYTSLFLQDRQRVARDISCNFFLHRCFLFYYDKTW